MSSIFLWILFVATLFLALNLLRSILYFFLFYEGFIFHQYLKIDLALSCRLVFLDFFHFYFFSSSLLNFLLSFLQHNQKNFKSSGIRFITITFEWNLSFYLEILNKTTNLKTQLYKLNSQTY